MSSILNGRCAFKRARIRAQSRCARAASAPRCARVGWAPQSQIKFKRTALICPLWCDRKAGNAACSVGCSPKESGRSERKLARRVVCLSSRVTIVTACCRASRESVDRSSREPRKGGGGSVTRSGPLGLRASQAAAPRSAAARALAQARRWRARALRAPCPARCAACRSTACRGDWCARKCRSSAAVNASG